MTRRRGHIGGGHAERRRRKNVQILGRVIAHDVPEVLDAVVECDPALSADQLLLLGVLRPLRAHGGFGGSGLDGL